MFALAALSLLSLAMAAPSAPSERAEPAALLKASDSERAISGQYIVKMKNTAEVSLLSSSYDVIHSYTSDGFRGFSAKLDDAALEQIRNSPDVEYVEQDQTYSLFTTVSQDNSPWHLSRISHRDNGATNYLYDDTAGEGTCVYIIDTGIKVDHEEFEGRAEWVQNFTDDGDDRDGAGHGTFVSGIVASRTYGVAKKARVLALKVFRSDGTTDGAWIIAAMDFVARDAATRDCPRGHVANMSLGGGRSQASNDAADAMVSAGVFVAVAAGNSNEDAANTSPASAPLVCTVAASDPNDARASFSSYGSVVELFAPGVNIESTSYEGGSTVASGTSASSPVVAGLAAYLLGLDGNQDPQQLCQRLQDLSTKGILSDVPSGTPNNLIFNNVS